MSRWKRVVRGLIGLGLTFAAGVGLVASVIAGVVWLLPGGRPGVELIRVVVASSIWAFPIGVAFGAFLAATARGRPFSQLSLPRFAALGAAGGLVLFGVLAANAFHAWSPSVALANLVVFVVLGAGSSSASLLLARRAERSLPPGDPGEEHVPEATG